MKIATYVDGRGQSVSVYEPGTVRVYDNDTGPWTPIADIPFSVTAAMTLADVKSAIRTLAGYLDGCNVLLSGEVRGLVYSLLQEENGFRVWKTHGDPSDRLEDIARQDAELVERRKEETAARAFEALFASPSGGCGGGGCGGGAPRRRNAESLRVIQSLAERLDEDRYRIDLADILGRYKNANSMDVLIPFLEGTKFRSLEILCDHVPRWFSQKIADLHLIATIEQSAQGVRALVSPNPVPGEPT